MTSVANFITPAHLRTVAMVGSACMALLVIALRMKAAQKPASVKKIVMPPLGMSTGFLMFVFPFMQVPWSYALGALLIGLLFSLPLIQTSKFEVRDGDIYLKRSKAFVYILLCLFALRFGAHSYVEQFVTLPQTGAIFFLLAFGMLLPWRVAMYRRFRQLQGQHTLQKAM